MKNPLTTLAPLAGIFLLQCGVLFADDIKPVELRYAFKPGQTNAYSLEIESQGESGREAIAGNYTVSCRSAGSNLMKLSFQGRLQQTNRAGMMPRMGYFGPGSAPSLSSYTWISSFPGESKELTIDDRGTVLREAGDIVLPIPLGPLMDSLLEKFPVEPTTGWEQSVDVFVLDEPLFQGPANAFLPSSRFQPMNFFPGQRGQGAQGVLTARKKTKVRVTEVTAGTVSFEKTLNLDSYMMTGAEPRVSATGQCKCVFDRIAGCPKTVEWDCAMVAVTEDLSRRSALKLRWETLEGAEREAALAPPPSVPPEKPLLSAEKVTKLLVQLNSDDLGSRQAAAMELSGGRLENPTPEILHDMTALADDSNDMVRHAAFTILANYGTSEQAPALLKGLHDSSPGITATILHGLARLKDPRTAATLADFLASGQNEQQYYQMPRANDVAETLIKIGPAAEAPTLALLKEKNIETRVQACLVLKQIGTKRSLRELKDLTLYPSKELNEAAASAWQSIQERATQ